MEISGRLQLSRAQELRPRHRPHLLRVRPPRPRPQEPDRQKVPDAGLHARDGLGTDRGRSLLRHDDGSLPQHECQCRPSNRW